MPAVKTWSIMKWFVSIEVLEMTGGHNDLQIIHRVSQLACISRLLEICSKARGIFFFRRPVSCFTWTNERRT